MSQELTFLRHLFKVNQLVLAFSLILFLLSAKSFADNSSNVKVVDGLPLGLISDLHIGKTTLYIGSETGFHQLTGNHVKSFSGINSSTNGEILSIREDTEGNIWLATVGSGLLFFDSINQKFLPILSINAESLVNCWSLTSLDKSLLLAACDDKILSIDIKKRVVSLLFDSQTKPFLSDSRYTKIAIDHKKNLWIAGKHSGVFRINTSTLDFEYFNSIKGPPLVNVDTIFIDSSNNIWVSNDEGISFKSEYSNGFTTINSYPDETLGKINSIFEDSNGTIWFGGEHLYVLDDKFTVPMLAKYKFPLMLGHEITAIVDIEQAKSGEILIAANTFGVVTLPNSINYLDYLRFSDEIPVPGLSSSFLFDMKNLLFSVDDTIYKLNLDSTIAIKLEDGLGYIDTLTKLDSNSILFSAEGTGIKALTLGSDRVTELSKDLSGLNDPLRNSVYTIANDGRGNLYYGASGGSERGLYYGDVKNGFVNIHSDFNIDEIAYLTNESLVVATRNNGIYQLHNKIWESWPDEAGSSRLIHYCIIEAQDGTVWLCTNGNGLGYLDEKSRSIQYIDPKFTANSTFIRELVQDTEGYFWVMTNQGLVRYDHKQQTSIRLGKEDGVLDVDFEITASINLSDDKILVAGDTLNYIIDTKKANQYINKRLQRKTEAKLVDLIVSQRDTRTRRDKTVDMKQAISTNNFLSFTYNEFLFNLEFAANNFAERNVFSFEYRLLGLDDNWTQTSKKEAGATYSTLPAGNYTFEVRVIDPKSIADQPVTKLNINVLPPLWKTWQAYTVYLLTVFCLLSAFYKYRTLQLKKANKLLELSVAERTSELADSKDRISNLLTQKQSLFANVSHEFRTPLSLILGPLETLGGSLESASQKKNFSLIYRSAKRLNHLVDQILDLAKLETVHSDNKKKYSIEPSIELLVESFKSLAESKQQQIILVTNTTGTLLLFQDSLEKIVSNLLSNSIKYTQVGGTILINSQQETSNYRFSVTDNGPGIPDDKLTIIFDRYARLHETQEEVGSGLGLAVVNELAKANGGSVQIESKVGEGSKFTIILPLHSSEAPADSTFQITPPEVLADYIIEDSYPKGYLAEANISRKSTVLIIEDNVELREFLSQSLGKWYVCITADDGVQGIARAIDSVPDLIISDLMMLNKDGFEVAQAIRQHDSTCHIPFILLTAKGDDATRIEGWKKQIDDYICKPFNVEELITRVSNLLSLRDMLKKRFSRNIEASIQGEQSSEDISFSSKRDQDFYQRFVQTIEKNYTLSEFGRAQAATLMAMSERQLNRKLSALIDFNFSEFLRKYRLEQARKMLRAGGQITEVSYDVGFSSPSYFSSCFKAEYGVSPKDFVDD